MLYLVYGVLGVYCTWCRLYLVYGALGAHCAWCMLYSVYTVISVNSGSRPAEIEMDDFNSCF